MVDEHKEMDILQKMISEKKAGTLNGVNEGDLEQYVKAPEDKVFNKFRKRIARNPNQVLRYDRGGNPLWITAQSQGKVLMDVPNCEHCCEERQFEFQV